MVHVLIAVIQIGQGRRHLVCGASRNSGFIESMNTDIDASWLGNVCRLAEPQQTTGFMQAQNDQVCRILPAHVEDIMGREHQLINSNSHRTVGAHLRQR